MTLVNCVVFILIQAHPSSLLLFCIRCMITAQNLVPVRVIPG